MVHLYESCMCECVCKCAYHVCVSEKMCVCVCVLPIHSVIYVHIISLFSCVLSQICYIYLNHKYIYLSNCTSTNNFRISIHIYIYT